MIDGSQVRLTKSGVGRRIISPGKHEISIEASGYLGTTQTYTLKRGIINKINISLRALSAPTKISDGKLLAKGDDSTFYFLGEGGARIFKSSIKPNTDGTMKIETIAITDARLSGVREIIWSPDRQLALFRKDDGIYLFDFYRYDFQHQTETLWGRDIGSIAWAPDNSKIAYYNAPDQTLIFSNITNTAQTRILNLAETGMLDPILRWSPDSSTLLIIPRNKDYSTNKVFALNISNLSIKSLTEGNQIDALFTPVGKNILYGTYVKDVANPINTLISVMNADGQNQTSSSLRAYLSRANWRDDDNLLAISYDVASGKERIVNFSVKANQSTVIIPRDYNGGYDSVAAVSGGNIVIFQSDDAVYAFSIN